MKLNNKNKADLIILSDHCDLLTNNYFYLKIEDIYSNYNSYINILINDNTPFDLWQARENKYINELHIHIPIWWINNGKNSIKFLLEDGDFFSAKKVSIISEKKNFNYNTSDLSFVNPILKRRKGSRNYITFACNDTYNYKYFSVKFYNESSRIILPEPSYVISDSLYFIPSSILNKLPLGKNHVQITGFEENNFCNINSFVLVIDQVKLNYDCVNVNEATWEEIINIKGVGPELTKKILLHRPFENIDEFKKIQGIGEKMLNKIKNKICF